MRDAGRVGASLSLRGAGRGGAEQSRYDVRDDDVGSTVSIENNASVHAGLLMLLQIVRAIGRTARRPTYLLTLPTHPTYPPAYLPSYLHPHLRRDWAHACPVCAAAATECHTRSVVAGVVVDARGAWLEACRPRPPY